MREIAAAGKRSDVLNASGRSLRRLFMRASPP
jgi:hypothetical protein